MPDQTDKEVQTARQKLTEGLGLRYEIGEVLGVGGAGIVFKVRDVASDVPRVAKVLRPTASDIDILVKDFREEAKKLAGLRHQHLVTVFEQSRDDATLPYFVMEFVSGQTLDLAFPAIVKQQLGGKWTDSARGVFIQLAEVLAYLHSRTPHPLLHLDVKPENIVLARDYRDRPFAVLLDLGLSRFESKSNPEIEHTAALGTFKMWPRKYLENLERMTTPGRTVYKIRRDCLNVDLDLHLLGRTMAILLESGIENDPVSVAEWPAALQLQYRFMQDVTRSLDIDEATTKAFPKAAELRTALRRLELRASRVRGAFDLGTVKLPGRTVSAFGTRAKKLADVDRFQRLRGIHQLGLAYMVYPGAVHTRFEHSLGAFENALAVLDQLSGPQGDYRFRAMASDEELVATAIVALLHDIGHYPFAHQLRIKGQFPRHEERTLTVLKSDEFGTVIKREFSEAVYNAAIAIMSIVIASEDPLFEHNPDPPDPIYYRVLRQIVSSTIDVDKLDYVNRDSIHCGVPYGKIVDRDRFLSSLRIWWDLDGMPHLLLSDKGRVCAEALVFARYVMFSEVYWNHGVRAFAAMLSAAIDQTEEQELATHLWDTDAIFLEWLSNRDRCLWFGELVRSRRPYRRAFVHQRLGGSEASVEGDKQLFEILEGAVQNAKILQLVREAVAQELGITGFADHEIVLDVPRKSRVGGIQVLPEGKEEPGGVGPIFDAIGNNFDGFARKARIFVHPRLMQRRSVADSTRMVRKALRKQFHLE